MSADEGSKIYYIDGNVDSRRAMVQKLLGHGLNVEGFSGPDLFSVIRHGGRPSCVVADLDELDIDALDVQRRLSERDGAPPLLFISARVDVRVAVKLMERGAVTVLIKPFDVRELLDAVRRGQISGMSESGWARQATETFRCLASLTEQERDVLQRLLDGDPNKNIASALNVSLRTVETRRRGIFKKMKTDNLARLVRKVVVYEIERRHGRTGQGPHFNLDSAEDSYQMAGVDHRPVDPS